MVNDKGEKMKSAELKKTLERFDKKELIRLIIEFAKLKKDNMEWLEIELQRPDELPELRGTGDRDNS